MFSKKLFMPVIHIKSKDLKLIMKNVDICTRNPIKAIWFFPNSSLTKKDLIHIFKEIKRKYPTLWIGCKFLDSYNEKKFFSTSDNKFINGVLIENPYLSIDKFKSDKLYKDWINSGFEGFYFGLLPFNSSEQSVNLSSIHNIINKLDILTISNDSEEENPSLEKFKEIRNYIPEGNSTYNKIAVSSDISIDSINKYIPYVNYFIISSSIEDSFGVLNEQKVRELSNFILEYNMNN